MSGRIQFITSPRPETAPKKGWAGQLVESVMNLMFESDETARPIGMARLSQTTFGVTHSEQPSAFFKTSRSSQPSYSYTGNGQNPFAMQQFGVFSQK